jgi:hypothetical protein
LSFLLLLGLWVLPVLALARFVNHADGTISDNRTGLMWATRDNGSPINRLNALYYRQKYSVGGHIDWQLPTNAELASLTISMSLESVKLIGKGGHIQHLVPEDFC